MRLILVDANDGLPLADATVRVVNEADEVVRQTRSNEEGAYRMQVPLGAYAISAGAKNYVPESDDVVLDVVGEVIELRFALRTARAELTPSTMDFLLVAGERKTKSLTVANTGSADLAFSLLESGGSPRVVSTSTAQAFRRNPSVDPAAMDARGVFLDRPDAYEVATPGEVLFSFNPADVDLPWGVGSSGDVWIGDPSLLENHEYRVDGVATGRTHTVSWADSWQADMAYDTLYQLMCQLNVGGDNGIYCWDLNAGHVVQSITGRFPWTAVSQRGLAYRPDDDTFYVGGWNEGILYHVKGFSWGAPGEVLNQCAPSNSAIAGLAYNATSQVVWAGTNSPQDTLYQLNPETCEVLGTLGFPERGGYNAGGLELDPLGNLWMVSMGSQTVYLVDSGLPASWDIPWFSVEPLEGVVAPEEHVQFRVTVDATDLEPGVYPVSIHFSSNDGRHPRVTIPIEVIVPAYRQAVNVGDCVCRRQTSSNGEGFLCHDECSPYEDHHGDIWSADQDYEVGGWGYYSVGRTRITEGDIYGTEDVPLWQSQREGFYSYRFDGLPEGNYQVELLFAELQRSSRPGDTMFDVIINGELVVPALDVVYEAGILAAYTATAMRAISSGYVDMRFVPRTEGSPFVNAIRVTHRPDL
jgi:hypothetical protein